MTATEQSAVGKALTEAGMIETETAQAEQNHGVGPEQLNQPETMEWAGQVYKVGRLPAVPGSIAVLLAQVAEAVGPIPKDDNNTDQGFKFRGIERILAAAGPALTAAGITPIPHVTNVDHRYTERGQYKNKWEHYLVYVDYEFVGPRGDSLTAQVVGEGLDNADKGISKAMTMAYKTALLQVLKIADPDNPDPDGTNPDEGPSPQRQRATSRQSSGSRSAAKKATAPKRPTAAERLKTVRETAGDAVAEKVALIVAGLGALPNEKERKAVKVQFVESHGDPYALTAETVDDALAWVTLIVGNDEPQGDPCPTEGCVREKGHDAPCVDDDGAVIPGTDTPPDPSVCRICGAPSKPGEDGYCADHTPF